MFNKLKQAIALAEEKEFEVNSLDILIDESTFDSEIEEFLKADIAEAILTEDEIIDFDPEDPMNEFLMTRESVEAEFDEEDIITEGEVSLAVININDLLNPVSESEIGVYYDENGNTFMLQEDIELIQEASHNLLSEEQILESIGNCYDDDMVYTCYEYLETAILNADMYEEDGFIYIEESAYNEMIEMTKGIIQESEIMHMINEISDNHAAAQLNKKVKKYNKQSKKEYKKVLANPTDVNQIGHYYKTDNKGLDGIIDTRNKLKSQGVDLSELRKKGLTHSNKSSMENRNKEERVVTLLARRTVVGQEQLGTKAGFKKQLDAGDKAAEQLQKQQAEARRKAEIIAKRQERGGKPVERSGFKAQFAAGEKAAADRVASEKAAAEQAAAAEKKAAADKQAAAEKAAADKQAAAEQAKRKQDQEELKAKLKQQRQDREDKGATGAGATRGGFKHQLEAGEKATETGTTPATKVENKDGLMKRAGKFISRHKVGTAAAALGTAALVGGGYALYKHHKAKKEEEARRKLAQENLSFFVDCIDGEIIVEQEILDILAESFGYSEDSLIDLLNEKMIVLPSYAFDEDVVELIEEHVNRELISECTFEILGEELLDEGCAEEKSSCKKVKVKKAKKGIKKICESRVEPTIKEIQDDIEEDEEIMDEAAVTQADVDLARSSVKNATNTNFKSMGNLLKEEVATDDVESMQKEAKRLFKLAKSMMSQQLRSALNSTTSKNVGFVTDNDVEICEISYEDYCDDNNFTDKQEEKIFEDMEAEISKITKRLNAESKFDVRYFELDNVFTIHIKKAKNISESYDYDFEDLLESVIEDF